MKYLAASLLVLALAAQTAATAQTTQKFTAAKHNEYGLTYALPITHIAVTIEAKCTVKKAGPYYKYAKKYLGLNNVITADSKQWDITKVSVSSFGVVNQEEQYLMQFKNGSPVYVMKDEAGLLLSINTENVQAPANPAKASDLSESVLDNNNFASVLSGELIMSESTAKRAEIAAQQIYKIRESRTNFATGEADQMPDGEALKVIMDQLNKQEASLMALFVGTTQYATAVETFDFTPGKENVTNQVIARISDFEGITSANDLSGEPVYLSMKIQDRATIPVDDKGVEKKLPKGAVMYNIPGKAQITITCDGNRMAQTSVNIAQLGVNFGVDPELFSNKKQASFAKFDPRTGAILELGAVE